MYTHNGLRTGTASYIKEPSLWPIGAVGGLETKQLSKNDFDRYSKFQIQVRLVMGLLMFPVSGYNIDLMLVMFVLNVK